MYTCRNCGTKREIRYPGTVLFLHAGRPSQVRMVGPKDSCILLDDFPGDPETLKVKGHEIDWKEVCPFWCSVECFEEWAEKVASRARANWEKPTDILCEGKLNEEGDG